MHLPRLFAAGLWLGVTAAATGMVWTATSIVAADVTDRPPPVVAQRDVVTALTPAAAAPQPTTTTTAAAHGPASTRPASGAASGAPGTTVPVSAGPSGQGQQPAPTTPTTPPPTTVAPMPTTRPTTPTTVPPGQATGTYSTAGGVVRVACSGLLISLVSAIPTNGFATNIVAAGPANVDVHFVGRGQDLSVKAVCFGQPIRYDGQFPTR